jgi:acyl carrier protein
MTQQQQQIFNDVVSVIARHANNKAALDKVARETDIQSDLQVNSARFVDIVIEFEQKFGVEISDSDADALTTVGDAVDLISKKVH